MRGCPLPGKRAKKHLNGISDAWFLAGNHPSSYLRTVLLSFFPGSERSRGRVGIKILVELAFKVSKCTVWNGSRHEEFNPLEFIRDRGYVNLRCFKRKLVYEFRMMARIVDQGTCDRKG